MNLILFGPPGAGKGTQSDKICYDFKLLKVSTGDLLRAEINKKSSLGIKIKEVVNKGSLVSDFLINNLIEKLLLKKEYHNRLVFDGYPRTLNQAKSLENLLKKFNQKIYCALILKVDKEVVVKRIMGRMICSKCGLTFNEYFNPPGSKNHSCDQKFLQKRTDDKESTIEARYETYLKQTIPIIDFYNDRSLLREINGVGEISSIYKEICDIISTLKG